MIYEYTRQDIPKAWKAGYRFVEAEVLPKLVRVGGMDASELVRHGEASSLWFRHSMHQSLDVSEAVVREGLPSRPLFGIENLYRSVYDILFLSIKGSPGSYNLIPEQEEGFAGYTPSSGRVTVPVGSGGESSNRRILEQLTPVANMYYLRDEELRPQTDVYGERGLAMSLLAASSHEFGHAVMQPGVLSMGGMLRRYLEGESRLQDVLTDITPWIFANSELNAEMFMWGATMSPKMWVQFRYGYAASTLGGNIVKPGEPLELRVMSPSILDDPQSPLHRAIRRVARDIEFAVEKGRPPSILERLFRGVRALPKGFGVEDFVQARNRFYENPNVENSAELSRQLYYLASNVYSVVQSMGARGELGPDAAVLAKHAGTRSWIFSYVVGKARPDLIGKTITLTMEGDAVAATGEKLDLGEMLPELNIEGPAAPEEVHPVVLERAFNALSIYNRSREALRQGYRFEPPPLQAADVVNTWRQEFERIAG